MLRINQVEAAYGHIIALRGVSLEVPEGSIVTLLGANGAGKTTMLRLISGVIRPRQGTVEFMDRRIDHLPPERIVKLGVAHVPEGRRLFAGLTIMENLKMGSFIRRDSEGVKQDLDMIMAYFPILRERHNQLAGTLSGGERQMLAIGRALMARPKLLLLDEPSLGLAPKIVLETFDIIQTLNREEKTTILLVEQNAHLALDTANYGYVLQTGEVVLSGTASKLKESEEMVYTYLGHRRK